MTRVSVLEIPAPADWISSNGRAHFRSVAKLTKLWRQAGYDAVDRDWAPYEGRVHVVAHFWKPRNGRYDPNNLWPTVKAAVDGIVDSGLIVDDDHKHVVGPDMRHGGIGAPKVILTITEIVP